jgi:selenocysteine lyase/cysteine desulfurase
MKLLAEIECAVLAALTTYSNVHRGSGHHSLVTTQLYERARAIVLQHLSLSAKEYCAIFCTPRWSRRLMAQLPPESFRCISSDELGLPLGIRALAVRRAALPKGAPFQTGGGTARLIGPDWAIWANLPDRFEAGTPPIINVIALALGLQSLHGEPGRPMPEITSPAEVSSGDLAGPALLARLRETLIGRDAMVPTCVGERAFVNLDNAASTPTFVPIWEEVRRAWRASAQERSVIIDRARQRCVDVLGTTLSAHKVLFTSNTTEAINLVAESLGKENRTEVEPVVLNSLLEHNSNELPWRAVQGCTLVRLPIDVEGFIDLGQLEGLLRDYNQVRRYGRKRIELVAVSGASNVLGTYNDIGAIGRIVHQYGARLLVDGAQWVAHRKVDIQEAGIDYFAFSGHKVYAPFGTGVLLARKGMLTFTEVERDEIRASGEENVGGIAALAKALGLLQQIGFETIQAEERKLTERALSGLAHVSGVRVHGITSSASANFARKGGVVAFDLKAKLAGTVARRLVEHGIGVRYGCHCAHLTIKRVLRVPPWAERLQHLMARVIPRFSPPGVVRISFGLQTTEADVDAFLQVMGALAKSSTERSYRRRLDDYLGATCDRVLANT